MSQITYGNHTIDTDKLPPASIDAMLSRGISHYLGNEQASRVSAFVEAEKVKGNTVGDAEKATAKADFVKAAVDKLLAGTVGQGSSRGPRGTTVDTVIRQLAEKEVRAVLKAAGITMPSGEKVVEFSDGTKLTKAQLIDRRVAKRGDALRKEAEAEIKRLEREATKSGGVESLL